MKTLLITLFLTNSLIPPAFTEAEIAKYVISTVMGRPVKTMTVKKGNGYYIVSYRRQDDGKPFTYKVKTEGSFAKWGNIDGRWRDLAEDGIIAFRQEGRTLFITQRFSDGSSDTKRFTK